MLQRAASNAYSWWWASHIRTKQSKWLEQSLQDMEEKVQGMLKLIEEDGDSFAKRAEMYYKRRPELINSVEEAYKVFRSLADRFDHLSKELQNANHTIATVFPEQVPFMDDDEGSPMPKMPKDFQMPPMNMGNIPNVPKAPTKDFKGLIGSTAPKQFLAKKAPKSSENHNKVVVKSGLNKDEALEEVDKLHKNILALQTGKEFIKSSYESSLSKYWEMENQIMEMQQKVCLLQDEHNVDRVIEDSEARSLMAEAALKSCQETLNLLQEKQEKSATEAREEYKKIEAASLRLKSLKHKLLHRKPEEEKPSEDEKVMKAGDDSEASAKTIDVVQESANVEQLKEKSKEILNLNSVSTLTMTELAEKIDELVSKVIRLETSMSSHTVLISTLRTDTDDLHVQIRNLEDEKETLIGDTQDLSTRVKQLEEKLTKIQDLNKDVESQNSSLQTNFAEARTNLENLSEKLSTVKPDEEVEEVSSSKSSTIFPSEGNLQEVLKYKEDLPSRSDVGGKSFRASKTEDIKDVKEVDLNVQDPVSSVPRHEETEETTKRTVTFLDPKPKEETPVDHRDNPINVEAQGETEKQEELNWQQMLLSGMEDPDKVLLKEYNMLLKNYKEVKKKLHVMERKERDSEFEITLQIRELKKAIQKRDEEIQHLRQKLKLIQDVKGEESGALSKTSGGDSDTKPKAETEDLKVNESSDIPVAEEEDETKLGYIDTTSPVSIVEEKFRLEIDAILEENLDFWLRFSTTFHQIKKFKTEVQDLKSEISKQKEKKKQEGSITTQITSDVRPIYKHLMEIQTELTVWLEQSASLKDELKRRFSSLCSIQEEITKALKEGVEEDEIRFSSHQAAKFQGEILNMKHENNKVREELEAGLDHVRTLQMEIEKTIRMLNEEFGISSDQPQLKQSMSQNRVPLRSFIFGTKPKKQKYSIFSSNRRYHNLKSGPL